MQWGAVIVTDQPWWSTERRTHYINPVSEECSRCGKSAKQIEDDRVAECRVRYGIWSEHERRQMLVKKL